MKEENKRYIPINKGHFELETPDRADAFQTKMAAGWEADYREYRRLWVELPKSRTVRDYPLLVDLELSSVCNLKCPMCYTITDAFRRRVKKKFMAFALFKKIIDEIAGKVYAVRLSLRGEPTLHEDFVRAIRYAKEEGIGEVSFLTNASRLTTPYIRDIIVAGADWITVSIDGVDAMYEKIRAPLKFSETLEKLKQLKTLKEEMNRTKPVIKVQGIWPAIRPNPEKYYNILAPHVDFIAYNPLIDYLRKDKDVVFEKNFTCPQLYQRLVVASDGKMLICANDEDSQVIVGDAATETIRDIWQGDAMGRIRRLHEDFNGFKTISPCRSCYYPRKAVPDEKAVVGNREIWIQNYIDRKQEIGQ